MNALALPRLGKAEYRTRRSTKEGLKYYYESTMKEDDFGGNNEWAEERRYLRGNILNMNKVLISRHRH